MKPILLDAPRGAGASLGILIALAISLSATGAWAAGPRGWALGVALEGAELKTEDSEGSRSSSETGLGLELQLGYGFTDYFALYLALGGAQVEGENDSLLFSDDYLLAHINLGAKVSFPGRSVSPYLDVSLSVASASAESGDTEVAAYGQGVGFGGGGLFFINRQVAIDVGFRANFGEFTDFERTTRGVSVRVTDEDSGLEYRMVQIRGGVQILF